MVWLFCHKKAPQKDPIKWPHKKTTQKDPQVHTPIKNVKASKRPPKRFSQNAIKKEMKKITLKTPTKNSKRPIKISSKSHCHGHGDLACHGHGDLASPNWKLSGCRPSRSPSTFVYCVFMSRKISTKDLEHLFMFWFPVWRMNGQIQSCQDHHHGCNPWKTGKVCRNGVGVRGNGKLGGNCLSNGGMTISNHALATAKDALVSISICIALYTSNKS